MAQNYKRKNSIGIIASLILLSMAISIACSQDDEYVDTYSSGLDLNQTICTTRFGDENFYYIPDSLFNQTGCGYNAIHYVFSNYTIDSIKNVMRKYDDNVENFPFQYMPNVITTLTGSPVGSLTPSDGSQLSENVVSVNDIICVGPITYGGYSMTTGHATVITSIEHKPHFILLHCYDGCSFDLIHPSIKMLIRTSTLKNVRNSHE